MNQQKGFSLIEVLIALLLVSTFALALLQQQWQAKHMLNQLITRIQAIQYLDQIEESFRTRIKSLPVAPINFRLTVHHTNQEIRIKLNWKEQGMLTRKHAPLRLK